MRAGVCAQLSCQRVSCCSVADVLPPQQLYTSGYILIVRIYLIVSTPLLTYKDCLSVLISFK
jgi:hypothetical protein